MEEGGESQLGWEDVRGSGGMRREGCGKVEDRGDVVLEMSVLMLRCDDRAR